MDDLPHASARSLAGFRRYTWWSLVATVGMIPLVRLLLLGNSPLPPGAAGVVLVGSVTVGVAGVALVRTRIGGPEATSTPGDEAPGLPTGWMALCAVGATVSGATLLLGGSLFDWSIEVGVASALIAMLLPRPRRRRMIAAAVGGAAVLAGVAAASIGLGGVLIAAVSATGWTSFLCFALLAQVWTWEVTEQLDEARRTAAQLAIADERLRFAGDLHDIQGHHLQVIALKSELAARIAEQRPQEAAEQMQQVEELARQAIEDTRAVVQGLRTTSLEAEIANATKVLAAAEIDGRMQIDGRVDPSALPELPRQLLGLVVREATTNLLRHSRAQRATIMLRPDSDGVHLQVRNDGATDGELGPGGGLDALAARLAEAQGTLTWTCTEGEFTVTAAMPLPDCSEAHR